MHRLLCLLSTAMFLPAAALAAGPRGALPRVGPRTTTYVTTTMVGAASGVAPLDTNALVPRVNLPANVLNLEQLGSAGNGWTADQTTINNILAANPNAELEVPNAYHWPADTTGANVYLPTKPSGSQYFYREDGAAYVGGGNGYNACTAIGDGDLTECWNAGALNLLRHTRTGNPTAPELKIAYENSSSGFQTNGYPWYQGSAALQIDAQNDAGANGSVVGEQLNLNSYDANPLTDENVGYSVNVYKAGQGSTWQFSGQTQDNTGLPPGPFASVAAELDILANGPDAAESMYDPGWSNRFFIYLAPKENPTATWARSTAYATGTLVTATDAAGVSTVYVATTGGTSGGTPPGWPNSGPVTDGSVTWSYGEPYAVSVGTAIWLDNGESATTSYSAGIATNARYDDAVIDLSRAVLTEATGPGHGAAIRVAANEPIDFSGNALMGGQNLHTLQYATANNALVYQTPNGTAFAIADSNQAASFSGPVTSAGTITGTALIGSAAAGITAAGNSQASATVLRAQDNAITTCNAGAGVALPAATSAGSGVRGCAGPVIPPAPNRQARPTVLRAQDNAITTCNAGAGVALPAAVIGEQVRVLNRGAATCLVYPPSGGQIEASGTNAAVTLASGADATFETFTATQWYR